MAISMTNPSIGINHLPIAVLDVETTGLSAFHGDRVCEVGLVLAQGDKILDTFSTLVDPQRPISPGASRVKGLSNEMVQGAPVFGEVVQMVLDRIRGRALVCHNAPFDLGFLDNELARLNQLREQSIIIDTLELARRYFHFASNSLPSIAQTLGIENVSVHRALGDALTTFSVFRHFACALGGMQDLSVMDMTYRYQPIRGRLAENLLPPIIQEALANRREIMISYIDREDNETHRVITPLYVDTLADYVYLRAFCHLRQQERTFRMDRIVVIQLKGNNG